MNKYTVYPTLEETIYLHGRLIEEFGGSAGVRDLGLVESALARPRSGYYATIHEQAAALMQSLIVNHAFVDGNKRVGFGLTVVFLSLNGYDFEVDAAEGETFIVETLISKRADVATIARWLEKYSRPKAKTKTRTRTRQKK